MTKAVRLRSNYCDFSYWGGSVMKKPTQACIMIVLFGIIGSAIDAVFAGLQGDLGVILSIAVATKYVIEEINKVCFAHSRDFTYPSHEAHFAARERTAKQ